MKRIISFLSGPVMLSPETSEAFAKPAISHRSSEFNQLLQDVQSKLKTLTKSEYSTLMMGSGTLANEAIAANLSQLKNETGLIISNGEFGERLVEQAERHDLRFKILRAEWGNIFDYKKIEEILCQKKTSWIWLAHCETSTGVMNDLEEIIKIAKSNNVKVCVDCISSIGVYPIDLSKIYLASASSNKGLEALAGLGIVFYNHKPQSSKKIPKYFDIGYYHQRQGTPFTFSSNLLEALSSSLDVVLKNNKLDKIRRFNGELINFFREQNIKIIADEKSRSAAITTIEFNHPRQSEKLGDFLQNNGILIHYRNCYLLSRNWVQIGLFSNSIKLEDLKKLQKFIKQCEATNVH